MKLSSLALALAIFLGVIPQVFAQSAIPSINLDGPSGIGLPQLAIKSLRAANMNITTDQALQLPVANLFTITGLFVTNCSTNMTTAAGGIYGAASKGSPIIVAAAQTYVNATAATAMQQLTLNNVSGGATQAIFTPASTLFLSLTTGQGSASTCDVWMIYSPLY